MYYFETALTPNTFWVDMKGINFNKQQDVKKLTINNNSIYSGNALPEFVTAKPFTFAGL